MKAHLWFDVEEMQPAESGYYLTFVGATMGGGEPEAAYNYYDKKKKEWRDYESDSSMNRWANVVYWTDADPYKWYEDSGPKENTNEATRLAWENVLKAVEQYNIIRGLAE